MTQENKELLKDLCARLPYGVKVNIPDLFVSTKNNIEVLNEIFCGDDGEFRCNDSGMLIKHVKPYLFPLSSMTTEQKRELRQMDAFVNTFGQICFSTYDDYMHELVPTFEDAIRITNWLNKNHFDYRGLIEKGLAIDATGKGIY